MDSEKYSSIFSRQLAVLGQVSPTGTQYYLMLMEKGRLKQLENARVVFPEEEDVASMAGKVIECSYSPETGTWNFMRIRHDKETPNAFHVFRKVSSNLNFVGFCSSS
jgi:hypothetical protein